MCVEEKFKFFINDDKWPQQSRNFHYEALETLKMLWFPALRQVILPGLCIWILPGGLQLAVHPNCIGNSLSRVGDRRVR